MSKDPPDKLEPLYVMVDSVQLKRYKSLAKLGAITLREYVTRALETYSTGQTMENGGGDHANRRLNQHSLRIDELEKRVDALQRRLELERPEVACK